MLPVKLRHLNPLGSLRTRLRWSYALVSVIPLVLLGVILTAANLRAQRQNIADAQQLASDWMAREIRTSISAVDEQLLKLGQLVGPDRSSAEVLRALFSLRMTTPDIIDIAVLDQNGRERYHVSQLRAFHESELIDRSDDPLVQRTLTSGRVAQGAVTRRPDSFLFYPSYAPIFDSGGQVVGAVRAEVSANRLLRTLREAPLERGSHTYLADSYGNTQLSANLTRVASRAVAPAAVLNGTATVQEYINDTNEEVIGAWSPIAVQPATWWAVVEIPRQQAYASVQRNTLFLILQILLVVATTIAWGMYQARHILQPIQELRAGASTIGAGDLASRIPIRDHDEIGELAQEFNRMAEHLEASRDEIERQNERLRNGLALARDIQLGLLPEDLPGDTRHLAVHARSIPAYEVGGDFYTYIALEEHRVAVAIGDISGKGVGAALMMALASSTVEAQGRSIVQPKQLLVALNAQLASRLKANRMNAALLYSVIDLERGTLSVANAGMITPFLLRGGEVQSIEVYGLPLGAMHQARYEEVVVELEPDDLILLASDGIVEAHGQGGELFGFERLEEILRQSQAVLRPEQLVDELLRRVGEFMGSTEQHDDMTVIVIQPNLGLQLHEQAHAFAQEVAP